MIMFLTRDLALISSWYYYREYVQVRISQRYMPKKKNQIKSGRNHSAGDISKIEYEYCSIYTHYDVFPQIRSNTERYFAISIKI